MDGFWHVMSMTGLPPLTWLRAFEAAARHLSFTAAAGELHITQSAVSQQIRGLEQVLGRPLFIRRTRALQLTEAGSAYLPTVREAFDILAIGTRAFTGGDRGRTLILQCNLAFSTFWLAPRMGDLLARHPWLHLNLVTPIWDPERTASQAEVEIRFSRDIALERVATRLTRDKCYPVAHPCFAEGTPDWAKAPLFDCAGISGNWESWLAAQGGALPSGRQITLSSSFVFSLAAAEARVGMAMGHDTLCAPLLASGRLVRPFAASIEMLESYYLFAPSPKNATPATRALCSWIEEVADAAAQSQKAGFTGNQPGRAG
jgi:LysR family transcriptional regulator, glycine cleavage system transcriptional activator